MLTTAMRWNDDALVTATHIRDFPWGNLIKVDVLGASTLYHKNIVNSCQFKFHLQGEDLGFCQDAKRFGYELYCDTTAGLATHVMDKEAWIKDKTVNYHWHPALSAQGGLKQ